jgi:2-hydroxychromene-2-carboxylate isomerase
VDVRVVDGVFRASWVEGRDPSAPDTIAGVDSAAGYDARDVLARVESQAVKDALRAATDEAVTRGVFGAPTFFVDGAELFWGQDRLHFVEGAPFVPGEDRSGAPSGRVVEAFWDYSSPFAYLGMSQVDEVARRAGATVESRPMLLGGLFKAIGQVNVPMASWSAERQAYVMADMPRWAAYWGVPFSFPTRFPMNSVKALRATLAAPASLHRALRDAIFRAYWAEDRDISDDAVLAELLASVGADAAAVLAATQAPEVKAELIAATQLAVERGVFGAPTFIVDGELFWGQDRLDLVDERLRAPR